MSAPSTHRTPTRFPAAADLAVELVASGYNATPIPGLYRKAVGRDAMIVALSGGGFMVRYVGPAMVPQPCQQQQGAARRHISWGAALVDLRNDRENVVHYRLKWVLSRGFWLGYQRSRSGTATELLGMVRTGREVVAVELLHGGGAYDIERFPMNQQGLRAAMLAVEARVLDQAVA